MLTLEQVQEAVRENPELKTGIFTTFKDDFSQGKIVRTPEEDQLHLDNQLSIILPGKVEEKFNERFKLNLDQFDREIEAITGIPKLIPADGNSPKEKTTEYFKRALNIQKEKGGDPVTKERVAQLESMLTDTKSQYEQKLTEKEQQLFHKETEWQVNSQLDKSSVAVPMHLKTDEEKQGFINQQKTLIKQGFFSNYTAKKDDAGNIIYYEGDKPQMRTQDGKPKSAAELIADKFSAWFVPAQHTLTGTGTGSEGVLPQGGFTDKASIHKYLMAQGLDVNSKEYMVQFERLADENKIRI